MLRKGKPYSIYVLKAIKQIKEHIDDDPFYHRSATHLLEKIKNDCRNLPHRATVEKAFKETYGVGIKEYLVKQRLEASKRFLEDGMSKKTVAYKCYYSSQSSFAAAFKKQFKMTPTEYQVLYSV